MKYTRYNHKKKGNNDVLKFIISLVLTITLAGGIGLGLAKVIFGVLGPNNNTSYEDGASQQTNNEQPSVEGENKANEQTTQVTGNATFDMIQCGYFSNKGNAEQVLAQVGSTYGGFISDENGKFRVVAGIYSNGDVQGVIDELKSKSIDTAKITYKLNQDDEVQNQIAGICDGYLKILNTTFNETVKSVNTEDFKGWVSNLSAIDKGEKVEVLNDLKKYVSELPGEIKKEDVAKEMNYLYTVLSNFKG